MSHQSRLRLSLVFSTLVLFSFQNCGGFQAFDVDGALGLGSNNPGGGGTPVGIAGIQMAAFGDCRRTAGATSATLATCLNNGSQNAGFTATAIDACVNAGDSGDVELAVCLSAVKPVVHNHRSPKQFDIEACNTSAGQNGIANCLAQKGVQSGVQQSQIDTCILTATMTGVEKCLRAANAIPRKVAFMQQDVSLCAKVTGSNAMIANCLLNAELVPVTFTQTAVDACIASNGNSVNGMTRCLRSGFQVSKLLMQSHINECNASEPSQATIFSCIDSNGLNAALTNIDAAAVTNCINTAGIAGVARCLRNIGLVPRGVSQEAIKFCNDLAGQAGIMACLTANFNAVDLPATLTQTAIDGCITTAGLAGAKKCLTVTRKIFNDVPVQADVDACAAYSGAAALPANPLQLGIGACLDTQGLAMGTITQAQIDSCILAATVPGVVNCLYTRGNIGSFQRLIAGVAPQNVFNRCLGCHGDVGGSGGLAMANHAQVAQQLVAGDAVNSAIYKRVQRNVAGFNAMPPNAAQALNADGLERVRTWIQQGARNN